MHLSVCGSNCDQLSTHQLCIQRIHDQLKIPLWEWSRVILAFSLRPIPFHQDNYAFQFNADNNLRYYNCPVFFLCFVKYCFFALLCLVFSLISFLPRLLSQPLNYEKTSGLWSLRNDVIKENHHWRESTKTYEGMISIAIYFQDKLKINWFMKPLGKLLGKITVSSSRKK